MDVQKLDLEIEKLVFLLNAKEGTSGLYELTWELSCYSITIENKYEIAHRLLRVILNDELVILQKFSDLTLTKRMAIIHLSHIEEILNNPSSWYPCNEIYAINLTDKGKAYLNEQSQIHADKLTLRCLYKPSQS